MTTLAKGLAVMKLFGEERPTVTLSEAAAATGISRATARRILLTLAELGYVEQTGRDFALAPRVLELGTGYVKAQSWVDRAAPALKELSETVNESASIAVLQGVEIVYVARVSAPRIVSTAITVGTSLPALHSSLGRAQLGFLDEAELWRRLKSVRLEPYTQSTITDLRALAERIQTDRDQGFSVVDEELEKGLRSIAVPLVDHDGRCVAAVNLSTNSTRTTRIHMREKFLPPLRAAADQIALSLP